MDQKFCSYCGKIDNTVKNNEHLIPSSLLKTIPIEYRNETLYISCCEKCNQEKSIWDGAFTNLANIFSWNSKDQLSQKIINNTFGEKANKKYQFFNCNINFIKTTNLLLNGEMFYGCGLTKIENMDQLRQYNINLIRGFFTHITNKFCDKSIYHIKANVFPSILVNNENKDKDINIINFWNEIFSKPISPDDKPFIKKYNGCFDKNKKYFFESIWAKNKNKNIFLIKIEFPAFIILGSALPKTIERNRRRNLRNKLKKS